MMPGMTGMDLHAVLSQENPDQARRMMFLTGGAFTSRAREFLDAVDAPGVEKPFDVRAMRELVANHLAQLSCS
jgi:FixJ family two-component response regulator